VLLGQLVLILLFLTGPHLVALGLLLGELALGGGLLLLPGLLLGGDLGVEVVELGGGGLDAVELLKGGRLEVDGLLDVAETCSCSVSLPDRLARDCCTSTWVAATLLVTESMLRPLTESSTSASRIAATCRFLVPTDDFAMVFFSRMVPVTGRR